MSGTSDHDARYRRSVNTAMVQAYRIIGHDIVEVEQEGKSRAGYGDEQIARLAKHLRDELGKGSGAGFGSST